MDWEFGILRLLVFASVVLLLYAWRDRTSRGHRVAMLGWVLFGLYWILLVPDFLDKGEPVNAMYCILGFPLFLYLAYHEHLCVSWGDDPPSLSFMAGTVAISAGMYFLIDTFEVVEGLFVKLTAVETAGFLSLLGYESHTGSIRYEDFVRVRIYHGDQSGISIILACTAIQSIVIFIAAILTTHADRARKWKAFLYTVPVIHVLNIVRTAAVVFLVYEDYTSFDLAHSYLSRWGSMLVLIVLAYWMFDILPELHDNIYGIPMLYKRKRPDVSQMGGETEHSHTEDEAGRSEVSPREKSPSDRSSDINKEEGEEGRGMNSLSEKRDEEKT